MNRISRKLYFVLVCFALCLILFCHACIATADNALIDLKSSAFTDGEMIPIKFTCDGQNISPELKWKNIPKGSETLVLICDDPDAPAGTWVHWVLFNIPANTVSIPENVPPVPRLQNGAVHGINDFGKIGYGGPCPPEGTHRYFFKVYALDTSLSLPPGTTKAQVLRAMRGHILGSGVLIGKYKR